MSLFIIIHQSKKLRYNIKILHHELNTVGLTHSNQRPQPRGFVPFNVSVIYAGPVPPPKKCSVALGSGAASTRWTPLGLDDRYEHRGLQRWTQPMCRRGRAGSAVGQGERGESNTVITSRLSAKAKQNPKKLNKHAKACGDERTLLSKGTASGFGVSR